MWLVLLTVSASVTYVSMEAEIEAACAAIANAKG